MNLDERKSAFRDLASCALQNSHQSLKTIWIALFTGGVLALVNSADNILTCYRLGASGCSISFITENVKENAYYTYYIMIMMYISYALVFYRFCIGTIRIFDIQFIEYTTLLQSLSSLKNPGNRNKKENNSPTSDKDYDLWLNSFYEMPFRNSYIVTLHALLVLILAVFINYPIVFSLIFCAIILTDAIWSGSNGNNISEFETIEDRIFYIKSSGLTLGSKARTIWYSNDLTCGMLMITFSVAYLYGDISLPFTITSLTTIIIINCALDLLLTWDFYHPDLRKIRTSLERYAP